MTPSASVFDADPSSGLPARAREERGGSCAPSGPGGESAPDDRNASGPRSHPMEESGIVRAAVETDLPAMGEVHAATMLASLATGHEGPLPEDVRAMVSAPVVAAGWEPAITAPPSRAHHVLVAARDGAVVGLAGVAPTELTTAVDVSGTVDDIGATEAERLRASEPAAEITALGVAPAHQRRGHGSRLLAAAADLARRDGATVLTMWVVRGDESLARLLTGAGLEPTGSHRALPVGGGVTEDCWAARL